MGRDDIWGVGLSMSAAASDTSDQFVQFQLAYGTTWLGLDRRLQVDDPAVRKGIVKALDAYTAIWRKGCTPPESVNWTNISNNKAFLAQSVVMTANTTLSIPAALKRERPDDYQRNAATIDWPGALNGGPLVIYGFINRGMVFKDGGHGAAAEQFVRSSPRRAGSPIGSISWATNTCRRCASWSSSPSGLTRAIRTACVPRFRS
jgi:multiple sugar transport system substrate-binding protein